MFRFFLSLFFVVYFINTSNVFADRLGINFIIPAAGNAKRLKSNLPKALHSVGKKTSLERIVDACNSFKKYNKTVTVIVSEKMLGEFFDLLPLNANYKVQEKKLGTADAVKQSFGLINKSFPVSLVLWGDSPMIDKKDIERMTELIQTKKCDYVSTSILNFKREKRGGKLSLRDKNLNLSNIQVGDVVEIDDITEKADMKEDEEPAILTNAGMTAFNTDILLKFIGKVGNNNNEKEYYLPHFIKLSKKYKSIKFCTLVINSDGALGFNTQEELQELSNFFPE